MSQTSREEYLELMRRRYAEGTVLMVHARYLAMSGRSWVTASVHKV